MIIEIVTATPTKAESRLIRGLMYFLIRSQLLAVHVALELTAGSLQLPSPLLEPQLPELDVQVVSLPVSQVAAGAAKTELLKAAGASNIQSIATSVAPCLKYLFKVVILPYYTAILRPNQSSSSLFLH
jgi:hypothetical protein